MRQDQALHLLRRGDSVFLTGAAGSGKTFVLNKFIRDLKKQKKSVAVTASTGIAATHLNGTTIHSWSGLGIRDSLTEYDKAWLAKNDKLYKRYNSTDVLIIDEISMLHGARLDMVNEVCKLLRGNDEPFGGMQVVMTGDLFQLPPVTRGGGAADFAHTSRAWQELAPHICYLSEQHRQKGGELLDLLEAMRSGQLEDFHHEVLQERIGTTPPEDIVATRLYSHNVDVETINDRQLAKLDSQTKLFEMTSTGSAKSVEQLKASVLAPEKLELKIGAEVMFVANNFVQHFANGTRGRVVGFNGNAPVVQLMGSKREISVEPHTWMREEDGRQRASVTQLPLRLAWAITIHKSQGMSLDSAQIDLSRSFTYGMGYVALSRVRDIRGLFLDGINNMALKLHPDIFAYDAELRRLSTQLANEIGEVELEEIKDQSTDSIEYDQKLFQALCDWRMERAATDNMPAYIIAHNTALEEVARFKPATSSQLLSLPGFGPKKLASYGDDILQIVKQHADKL